VTYRHNMPIALASVLSVAPFVALCVSLFRLTRA
jgi:hypothetical protein